MIRIPIKNGNIDAAIDKFNAVKKEQDKAFNESLANFLTPTAAAAAAAEAAAIQ